MTQVPITRTGTTEPITLINAFTVPVAESDRFVELWKLNEEIMAAQPGFVRARLHCSLLDNAELRYVNIAHWESGVHLDKAQANPAWQDSVRQLLTDPDLHITARPSVYQVIVDVEPGAKLV